jgi:hypothetical protein
MSDKIKHKLYTAFNQVFHAYGTTLDMKQMENLRIAINNIAELLQNQAKEETVELVRLLQEAIDDGFKKAYNHVDRVNEKVKKLEKLVNEISNNRTDKREDS